MQILCPFDNILDQYSKIYSKDIQAGFDLLEWAVDLVLPKEDLLGDSRHINGLKAYRDFKEGKVSLEDLKQITQDVWNTVQCLIAYRDEVEDGYDLYNNALPLRYIIDSKADAVRACHRLLKACINNKENQNCDVFFIAGMRDTLKVFCMFTDKIEKKVQEKYNEMFAEEN